jgi:hypothetical protein
MGATNLEKRIESLEREVRSLKRIVRKSKSDQKPWWERLAGAFEDDPVFDEIVKEGQKYRRSRRLSSSHNSE